MKKEEPEMLSPSEFAALKGKPYSTIMSWLTAGRVHGAVKFEHGKMKLWRIPSNATVTEPVMGRPWDKARKANGKAKTKKKSGKTTAAKKAKPSESKDGE